MASQNRSRLTVVIGSLLIVGSAVGVALGTGNGDPSPVPPGPAAPIAAAPATGPIIETPALKEAIDVSGAELLGEVDGRQVILANGAVGGPNEGLACFVESSVATGSVGVACYDSSRAALDRDGQIGSISMEADGTRIGSIILGRGQSEARLNGARMPTNGRVATFRVTTKQAVNVELGPAGSPAKRLTINPTGGVQILP